MKKALLSLVALSVVLVLFGTGDAVQNKVPATAGFSSSPGAVSAAPPATFMRAPLAFVPNQGQFDGEALFSATTPGYTLWLTAEGLVFAAGSSTSGRSVSRLEFLGAQPEVRVRAEEPSAARVNYIHGSDPSGWKTNLPTSSVVRYSGIYPNIDLKVYGTGGAIEYDWIVDPGGDPAQIRFRYSEADNVRISSEGDLVVRMPFGELRHRKPVCSQEAVEGRRAVMAGFKNFGGGVYGFEVGDYDRRLPLIIDPLVLVFSTFQGGTKGESMWDIAVDSQNAVYGVGYTESSNYPLKKAADKTFGGFVEGFLFKFDSNGKLVFSTFLGGNGEDQPRGVAVSPKGTVWVTGKTKSTNFPTLKALDSTANGEEDAFVAGFGSDGTLLSSTYLGGSRLDFGSGIVAISDSSVVVAGRTKSPNFPTKKARDASHNGQEDVFLTKLNSDASAILFSTFFGGRQLDWAYGVAADRSDNIYLTGGTLSSDFPVLNAFDSTRNGNSDVFVSKFSKTGALVYSTYFGGNGREDAYRLAVDSQGAAYVTGWTASINIPLKNAFDSTQGGDSDAFLFKLMPSGQSLGFSTYLGGSKGECGIAVCLDASGDVWVSGYTLSADFPLKDPWDKTIAGIWEGFISRFSSSGNEPKLSTFIGGTRYDSIWGLASGTDGSLYVGGGTDSTNFPVRKAHYPTLAGDSDNFIAKFKISK